MQASEVTGEQATVHPRAGDPLYTLALTTALRRRGVELTTSQAATMSRALAHVGKTAHGRYWAGRATMLTDPSELGAYESAFAQVEAAFGGVATDQTSGVDRIPGSQFLAEIVAAGDGAGGVGKDDREVRGVVASAAESLRYRRFADASADELAQIKGAIDVLARQVPARRSRRRRQARAGALDLAATLTASMSTYGEPFELKFRGRRARPVKVVLLVDVSGSMAIHARMLLQFAVAWRRANARSGPGQVEVFAFATRLTHLTRALSGHDVDDALAAAAHEVVDWDSGTTIGRCVDELLRRWGPRGLLSGAYVIVASDGLDRGDPKELAVAMRRLKAVARNVVWVNPLAGDERFVPIQRGMAAAMPSIDAVVSGDNLASLEVLAAAIVSGVAPPTVRRSPVPVN